MEYRPILLMKNNDIWEEICWLFIDRVEILSIFLYIIEKRGKLDFLYMMGKHLISIFS